MRGEWSGEESRCLPAHLAALLSARTLYRLLSSWAWDPSQPQTAEVQSGRGWPWCWPEPLDPADRNPEGSCCFRLTGGKLSGLGLRRSRSLVLRFCISSCRRWWLPVQRWASRSTGSPSRGPWPLAFLQQTAFGWVTGTAGHGSCLSLGSDSFLWGPMLSRVAPSP